MNTQEYFGEGFVVWRFKKVIGDSKFSARAITCDFRIDHAEFSSSWTAVPQRRRASKRRANVQRCRRELSLIEKSIGYRSVSRSRTN